MESFPSLLLPHLGQVHSPACWCGSRWMVLHSPKSYQKLCLLFSDSCNALPKFRKVGWRAPRAMCSNLVGSWVVLLLNQLLSRWNLSHCLGIFYYFIWWKNGVHWWYAFHFYSCWLTGVYSNVSYFIFSFIGEVGVVCTPMSPGGGSEKMCSGLQFAHLHVAARPLRANSCRHLSHLTTHA